MEDASGYNEGKIFSIVLLITNETKMQGEMQETAGGKSVQVSLTNLIKA